MSVNQSRTNSTLCSSTCASTSAAPVELSSITAMRSFPGNPAGALRPGRDLLCLVGLEDLLALLAGPEADGLPHRGGGDLPPPPRGGARVPEGRLLYEAHVLVLDHALQLQLGPQVDG